MPSPSEASAVEVLRALVASWDETGRVREPLFANARCVLAAAGPDPSEVVRAAIAWRDWDATPDTTTDADLSAAVDAHRTLAALDDEYQAAVAATKGEGE